MTKSCVGCKFLYSQGIGYSNYTWEEIHVHCAKDRNSAILENNAEQPYDWNHDAEKDNWYITAEMRCELYSPGPFIELDVDGDNGPADDTNDEEAIKAICEHSGRNPHGH